HSPPHAATPNAAIDPTTISTVVCTCFECRLAVCRGHFPLPTVSRTLGSAAAHRLRSRIHRGNVRIQFVRAVVAHNQDNTWSEPPGAVGQYSPEQIALTRKSESERNSLSTDVRTRFIADREAQTIVRTASTARANGEVGCIPTPGAVNRMRSPSSSAR